jgi:hypothetical protein
MNHALHALNGLCHLLTRLMRLLRFMNSGLRGRCDRERMKVQSESPQRQQNFGSSEEARPAVQCIVVWLGFRSPRWLASPTSPRTASPPTAQQQQRRERRYTQPIT